MQYLTADHKFKRWLFCYIEIIHRLNHCENYKASIVGGTIWNTLRMIFIKHNNLRFINVTQSYSRFLMANVLNTKYVSFENITLNSYWVNHSMHQHLIGECSVLRPMYWLVFNAITLGGLFRCIRSRSIICLQNQCTAN